MARKKINYGAEFSGIIGEKKSKELEVAKKRIAQLEKLLDSTSRENKVQIQQIPLEQIEVNPEQPRQTFFDVVEMKNLLLSQGQREPILLVQIPGREKFMIFDGERRYRAHILLGWSKIKALFIPYNPDTFQLDVLITALNKKHINALDEAEGLIKVIQLSLDLDARAIANQLSSFISYLRRGNNLDSLSKLASHYEQREHYLELIGFRNEAEKIICVTIADLGRSPITVSNNKFPLLKLSPDLKQAIRNQGLNEAIALGLNQINPENKRFQGQIAEAELLELKQDLIAQILENQLSLRAARKLIEEAISPYIGIEKKPKTSSKFDYLDKIKLEQLTLTDKQLLREKLENLLRILRESESSSG